MQIIRIVFVLMFIAVFSGCATLTPEERRNQCILGGAVVGAATGGTATPMVAGIGTIVGGITGAFFCQGTGRPVAAVPATPSDIPQQVDISEQPVISEQPGYFWVDDQDGDGVLDGDDHCPFTSAGVIVDIRGCANDADGDGVPDFRDRCPNTLPDRVVDTSGCEYAPSLSQAIRFEFDSAVLGTEAKSAIDKLLPVIQSRPAGKIKIVGHADNIGADAYNRHLSQLRADAVVDYLVSKGVDRSRLNTSGAGESSPASTNDTPAGRSENRRAEILLQ